MGVVFDPNIGDALLCKADETLCNDTTKRNRLKSRDAEKELKKIENDN